MISLNDDCGSCVHAGTDRTFKNESFIIKISKSKEEDSQFAFDFDPLRCEHVHRFALLDLRLRRTLHLFLSDDGRRRW